MVSGQAGPADGGRQRMGTAHSVSQASPPPRQSVSGGWHASASAKRPSSYNGQDAALWRKHVVEVFPGLWLGSREAACNLWLLRQLGVRACVNVTQEDNIHPDQFRYMHINVTDERETDLRAYFEATAAWVGPHLTAGRVVLVYCQAGVSRSSTMVLALLLHLRSMSLVEAWTHLKRLRPAIRPNAGFCQQLCEHERALRGYNTAAVDTRSRGGLVPASDRPSEALVSHRVI